MASYKMPDELKGIGNVLKMAREEAKKCFIKEKVHYSYHLIHWARFMAICDTLETLGIVDNAEELLDAMWDEAWEEYQKCNS